MNDCGFEFIEHTADLTVRAWGRSVQDLFIQTALGMCNYLCAETNEAAVEFLTRSVEVSSFDRESLMVDWLTQLLAVISEERLIIRTVDIQEFAQNKIKAQIRMSECRIMEEIKAVTYYGLTFTEKAGVHEVSVTFDL